jgi:hypothetical protein
MLRLADLFASVEDPRQAAKVERDLVKLPLVAVIAVVFGRRNLCGNRIAGQGEAKKATPGEPLAQGVCGSRAGQMRKHRLPEREIPRPAAAERAAGRIGKS